MADLFSRFNHATRGMKLVDPDTHAVLDYLTIAYFLLTGAALWDRDRRAGIAAAINAFMVLGVSMFTDYSGSARRLISFPTHGKMDAVQAAMAVLLPSAMGFGEEPYAALFRGQAMNEAMVLAITDWEKRGTVRGRIRRAA